MLRPDHQYLMSHLAQLECLHYSHFVPTLPSIISSHSEDLSHQSSKKSSVPHRDRVPEIMSKWHFSKYNHYSVFYFKYFRVKTWNLFWDNTCSSGNENYSIYETRIPTGAQRNSKRSQYKTQSSINLHSVWKNISKLQQVNFVLKYLMSHKQNLTVSKMAQSMYCILMYML